MSILRQLLRTAPLVHPEPGLGAALARVKYCVRGLLSPATTRAWFDLLARPQLAALTRSHPHVFSKLQRPYLHRKLGMPARLAVLRQHYDYLERALPAAGWEAVFAGGGLPLAALDGPLGRLELRLRYADQFEKEGDLTISLLDFSTGAGLVNLTFSLAPSDANRLELFIGGLQGTRSATASRRVVAITRHLHGLRPKALLLFALRQVAIHWGVDGIRAVGNGMHIYRHWRKRKTVHADYDRFWLDCGGVQGRDGLFWLPKEVHPRSLPHLKANKRPVYRRRYALLDVLADQIRWNLGCASRMTLKPNFLAV